MKKLVGLLVFLLVSFAGPCNAFGQFGLKQETITVLASDKQSKKKLSKKELREQEDARLAQEKRDAEDALLQEEFNKIIADQQRLFLYTSDVCALKKLNLRWNEFLKKQGDFLVRKDLLKKQAFLYSEWVGGYSSTMVRIIAGLLEFDSSDSPVNTCEFDAERELRLLDVPQFTALIPFLKKNAEEIKTFTMASETFSKKAKEVADKQYKLIEDAVKRFQNVEPPRKEFSAPPIKPE